MMPRPNWATLPVMCRSAVTVHLVLVGDSASAVGGDVGLGVAAAAGVAALGLEPGVMGGVVALDELRLALELGGHRAELDLDLAAIDVAFDLLQLGARAGRERSARRRR